MFVVQCDRCNNIIGNSHQVVNKTKQFYIFTSMSENIKLSEDFEHSLPVVEIENVVSQNVMCTCRFNIGILLETTNTHLNGYAGSYLVPVEFTKTYFIKKSFNHKVKNKTSIAELTEDIENIKNVLGKHFKCGFD